MSHLAISRASEVHRRKIYSDWLHSALDQRRKPDADAYRAFAESKWDHIQVVHPIDWADGCMAWTCVEGDACHYAYSNRQYRRLGLVTHLLNQHDGLRYFSFRRQPYSFELANKYNLTFRGWDAKEAE